MEEPDADVMARQARYLAIHSIEAEGLLGWGLDGTVWATDRISALKVHRRLPGYIRERQAYLRLRHHSVRRTAGFNVPTLINYDDSCLALELLIVERPFVVDFADAELDKSIPEHDDPAWLQEKARMFGNDWPDVQLLLETLRQYGVHFRDVHLQNISLRA